jgi:DNA invertase Pin-like site-specific DNA recombinase
MERPGNIRGGLRAGIYDRVSKKPTGKEARSVASQNKANRLACNRYEWTVAAKYADPGVSASRHAKTKRRDDYERLRDDVRAGTLDVIVFWESSRGDRKLGEWASFLDDCRDHHVLIYITSHDRLYDMSRSRDRRSLAEDGVDSEYETDKLSERVTRGLNTSLELGRPHGVTPFGCVRTYDRFRNLVSQGPDPATGWVPREVITRVADMEPVSAIRKDMAARGAPTARGGPWTDALVRKFALNPAYAALRIGPDGEFIDGMQGWEPVVPRDVWLRAYQRVTSNQHGSWHPGAKHLYLLSYLAMCGNCGGPLRRQPVRGLEMYSCKDNSCASIKMEWLDAYVLGRLCRLLDDPAFWAELLREDDGPVKAARAKVAGLRLQLQGFEAKAIEGEIDPESFATISKGLRAKIREAEGGVTPVTVPAHLIALHEDDSGTSVRELVESWPLATRKATLRDFYDGVILLPAGGRGRQAGFNPGRVLLVRKGQPVWGSGATRQAASWVRVVEAAA